MFRRFGHLFEYLFRRRRLEDDLDEELSSSLDMIVEKFVARGTPLDEARRAARLEFEGVEQVKEQVRDSLAGSMLQTCLQDVRYAWRTLWRRPSFAVIALITLALGIGVNTAVFSVFYAVLLRPLPYASPARLALIWTYFRTAATARAPVSGAILGEIQHRNRSFSGVAGIWTITRTFTGDDPEQVKFARVTTNFFDVLGVHADRGRTFAKEDSGGPATMLTDGFFRRRFANDAGLIGKGIPTQWPASTLIGVLPADFELHFAPDSNVPADVQGFDTFGNSIYQNRNQYYIRLVARLGPGISMAEAQRDLDRVAAEIRGVYTDYAAEDLRFTVASMQSDAVRDVRPALAALFAGAFFILLICCVNITSLLLARASDRRKEIALRAALGASRARILRQMLAEAAVLCATGGVLGIAAGWACFRGLLAIRPERFARLPEAGLNWRVVGFAAACSLAAAIVFGLAPALESFRMDLILTLRASGRGWLGRVQRHAGNGLVIAEISLAFVLVTGAALTARSLSKIEQVRPGFEPRQLLAFQMSTGLTVSGMNDWEAQLGALPGVEGVGATSHLPLDRDLPNWYSPFRPEGVTRNQAAMVSDLRCITPGFLAAMGARLLEGRSFDQQDRDGARQVVIVDDLLARAVWPGQSAIGKKVEVEHTSEQGFVPRWSVVVGVVEHIQNHSLTQPVRGQIYLPFEQSPRFPLTFVLRTRVDPVSLVRAVRQAVRSRSKNAAIAKVRPMTEYVAREISPASFTAVLAAVFGGLALLLAATGIYGVLDYQISRRLPEMGIRMALGAGVRDVLGLVLREAGMLAATGIALGAIGALIVARWLGVLLYGVSARDPMSYALAVLLLPVAALLGCWRPAWRAAAADPAVTIREE